MDKLQRAVLTPDDLRLAVSQGAITAANADRLLAWAERRHAASPPPREPRKGLNLVSIAYYFGALLMISACAWFLGDKWRSLGDGGILVTCLIYATLAVGVGAWLRQNGYVTAGGLLVTVAVALMPLVTYTIEDMLGMWPVESPGRYAEFYRSRSPHAVF